MDFLNGFAAYIEEKRALWNVPGVAVAVVKDGEVVFSQGFGHRDVEGQKPVTSETIFAIGSVSKSFAAISAAIAVDDGKLEWDKPVVAYYPAFGLKEEYASTHITMRDLLCHRSGLPRHDFAWLNSRATREELIAKMRYFEPSAAFRTVYQYQNFMYIAAGYIAGLVEGMTWEELTRERIFKPLGMTHTQFSITDSEKSPDYALPYQEKDGVVKRTDFRRIETEAVGPAGAINSNLVDMAKWLNFHLSDGKVGDQTVVSEANLRQAHAPQMVVTEPIFAQLYGAPLLNYGLGWMIQPFRDQLMLHHGGNIDGFSALASFMPAHKTGIVVLTNLNSNFLTHTVVNTYYDMFLDSIGAGGTAQDWHAHFKGVVDKLKAMMEDGKAKMRAARVENTQPSHELDAYVGEYTHPAYGGITITRGTDGALFATYNETTFPMKHFHYDQFEAPVEDFDISFMIAFITDAAGKIGSLEVALEPSLKPSSFPRVVKPEAAG